MRPMAATLAQPRSQPRAARAARASPAPARRRHGRPRLCVGAALRPVLPGHRLWRHAARRARDASAEVLERTITVRFDANVAPGLDWRFAPEAPEVDGRSSARPRRSSTRSRNAGRRPTTGIATFNVAAGARRRLFRQARVLLLHRADAQPGETLEIRRSSSTSIPRSPRTRTCRTMPRSPCPTPTSPRRAAKPRGRHRAADPQPTPKLLNAA